MEADNRQFGVVMVQRFEGGDTDRAQLLQGSPVTSSLRAPTVSTPMLHLQNTHAAKPTDPNLLSSACLKDLYSRLDRDKYLTFYKCFSINSGLRLGPWSLRSVTSGGNATGGGDRRSREAGDPTKNKPDRDENRGRHGATLTKSSLMGTQGDTFIPPELERGRLAF